MNEIKKKQVFKTAKIVAVILVLFCAVYIFLSMKIDFSQDYREVPGVENIVFQSNADRDSYYKRGIWGLVRTKAPQKPVSFEWYQSDGSVSEITPFQSYVEENDIRLRQALLSPDGEYILFCEIEYNYHKTGTMTDDEYCCYRVYDIETGQVVTIYEGYKEWYNLAWE